MFRPLSRKRRAGLGCLGFALTWVLAAAPALAAGYFSDATGVNGDLFGYSVSELEDINNDGRWEFLAGIPGDNTTTGSAGKVFLWYGGTGLTVDPAVVLTGTAPEEFGFVVARIGDVNRDGKADFAVGAPLASTTGAERGRVYVFYGGPLNSGTAAAQADLLIDGQVGGDHFGWSISAAGDFDGDGADDFIVGAPLNDNRAADAGAAYVIYGRSGGPSANLADATVLTGPIAGDHFGWAVSDAGNFLGGSEVCVAVGAPLNSNHGGLDAGAVFVYEGRLAGAAPDTTIDFAAGIGSAAKANAQYGFAVRNAGRWDSGSTDDLAIGAPYCDQGGNEVGRVEIIFGGPGPSTSGDRFVNGEISLDHFGWSLARVHDVLGNSPEDLLIGAPGSNLPAVDAGRAYVWRSETGSQTTASGLDAYPNVPLRSGTSAGDLYGQAVASAGDFDGDGLWDFAVGAPVGNSEPSGATSGFVHLLHSSVGPVAAEMQSWRAEWVAADDRGQVALAFALAEPADNVARLDLARQTFDAHGRLASTATLWSGAAERGAPRPGALTCDGRDYAFTDPGPAAPPVGGTVAYAVAAVTNDGRRFELESLAGPSGAAPAYGLAVAAFPNPSRGQVSFRFRARSGDPVAVDVIDVRGRLVRHLYGGDGSGAWTEATWDGRDQTGRQAAEGVYFLSARSPEGTRSRRLTLVR